MEPLPGAERAVEKGAALTELIAVLLGVLEGFTEFLPVSSTGHLVLATHALGLEQTEFLKSFEIAIQLGSILAVIVMFSGRFLREIGVWKRVIAGFLPAAVIGFLLYDVIKGVLLESPALVAINLILVGIILAVVDRRVRKREVESAADITDRPIRTAFLIGVVQAFAVVPGVSRSGATIIGGLSLSLSRKAAAEFSFLLAVPTMLAATGYDLLRTGPSFSSEEWKLLAIGSAAAFFVALLTVRWLLAFVSRYSFMPFAIYRVALGAVYLIVFI